MPAEADARYLETIAEDCLRILGDGVTMDGLTWDDDLGSRLTIRYRLGDREGESSATGETIVAAHAALRNQLVVDRVRLAFSSVVQPAGPPPRL